MRSTVGLAGDALAGEGEQVAHDAARPIGLLVNDPEMLPLRVPDARPLLQELGESGDGGERVVEFVRDAGDQLPDGRQLLALDQLRLQRPLLGHVLDQHHDRRVARRLAQRRGRQAEHPLDGPAAQGERGGSLAPAGGADQPVLALEIPHHGDPERALQERGLREAEQPSQPLVGPADPAGTVQHRDTLGQCIERGLPFLLRLAHHFEQATVGHHHGDVGGDRREQPQVLGAECALRVGSRLPGLPS